MLNAMASTVRGMVSTRMDIGTEPADQIDTSNTIRAEDQSAGHRFWSISELALLVFEGAPLQTLINCERVCRLWHGIISDTEVLQTPLNHSENGIALTGKQQVVLQHNIDTLVPPCQDQDCIDGQNVRRWGHCSHTTLTVDTFGAPHTGRTSLLYRVSAVARTLFPS